MRVYVDEPPSPVQDKDEIRRRLGYIKIAELANLRPSRQRYVPLVWEPETKAARKRQKTP